MSKRFKLVYEDNGMIKGSYSGIPSKGDVNLIERATLEGTKPVPPAPEPEPTPEELVDNEKSAQELYKCFEEIVSALVDDTVSELNIDRTFKFKDASFNYLAEVFTGLEAETFDYLFYNSKPGGAFSLDFEFSMHTPAVLVEHPDKDFPTMDFFNLKSYSSYPYGDTELSSCQITLKADYDTEIGGTYVVFNAPNKPFTGSLRVVFDGSKFVWPE